MTNERKDKMTFGAIVFFSIFACLIGFCIYMGIQESKQQQRIFDMAKVGNKTAMMLLSKELRFKKINEIKWEIVEESLKGNPFITEVLSETIGRK